MQIYNQNYGVDAVCDENINQFRACIYVIYYVSAC